MKIKYIALLLIVLSACKTKRIAHEFNINSNNLLYKNNLEKASNSIMPSDAYLFKSMKIKIVDEDKNYQFNSILKIVPDSGFIFSAIGPIGIELGRICVNKKEGYFINRMNKEVFTFQADSIYNVIGLPLSNEFIEDIFLNKFFLYTKQARIENVEGNSIIQYSHKSKNGNKYNMELDSSWFDIKNNTFSKYFIQSRENEWSANLDYKEFYKIDKYIMPKEFNMIIKIKSRSLKVYIKINKMPEITRRELNIQIPEQYKIKKGLKL